MKKVIIVMIILFLVILLVYTLSTKVKSNKLESFSFNSNILKPNNYIKHDIEVNYDSQLENMKDIGLEHKLLNLNYKVDLLEKKT